MHEDGERAFPAFVAASLGGEPRIKLRRPHCLLQLRLRAATGEEGVAGGWQGMRDEEAGVLPLWRVQARGDAFNAWFRTFAKYIPR